MGHVRLVKCQTATVKNKRQKKRHEIQQLCVCCVLAFNDHIKIIYVTQKLHLNFLCIIFHLAVTDTVDHLVIFTVESVCQEAQALQHNKDETDQSRAQDERKLFPVNYAAENQFSLSISHYTEFALTLVASSFSRSTRLSMSVES